jgi:hypothetical protein
VNGWPENYFNYFTETEEHFQRVRGTGLFLLSPLDWALIETWKDAGIPLEAVLRGIDAAFAKRRARKIKTQAVNSLAFCAQAVLTEADAMAGKSPPARREAAPPFSLEELRSYLKTNIAALRQAGEEAIAASLEVIVAETERHYGALEELEQRLTALEEKLIAGIRSVQTDEDLFQARQELDSQLRPYRSRMDAAQLAMIEKQFLERRLLEKRSLPRLSLFYLR